MEKNKGKVKLNDELLGKISGGTGFNFPDPSDCTQNCWNCGMAFSEGETECKYCGWPRGGKKGL